MAWEAAFEQCEGENDCAHIFFWMCFFVLLGLEAECPYCSLKERQMKHTRNVTSSCTYFTTKDASTMQLPDAALEHDRSLMEVTELIRAQSTHP